MYTYTDNNVWSRESWIILNKTRKKNNIDRDADSSKNNGEKTRRDVKRSDKQLYVNRCV